MFLYICRLWTSYILVVGPYSHLVSLLSLDPCVMTLITDFYIVYEPDDSRSRFKHFFTSPYHTGSTGLLKFRIFLNALPQSSKIMILREIEIKGAGGCYKLILTVIFSRSFPDWSDPKGVCPYQVCGSRNMFYKSPIRLHTFYWGWDLTKTLLLRILPPNHEFSGLKSGFDSISTTRSISISFSLILFMPGGDDRSFHEDLISECVCSLWFIW